MTTTQKPPKWRRAFVFVLAVAGGIVMGGAVFRGPTSYDVRLLTQDYSAAEHSPPMYLVQWKWWSLTKNEFPLRFTKSNGWEYELDGKWKMLSVDIEKSIDLEWFAYDIND